MKYDESKKVALIKEVKNILTDMNLVQVLYTFMILIYIISQQYF